MKKFVLVLIAIIFVGCSADVTIVKEELPEEFSKVYLITEQAFCFSPKTMQNFVDDFKTKDDVVIRITDLQYIILRK